MKIVLCPYPVGCRCVAGCVVCWGSKQCYVTEISCAFEKSVEKLTYWGSDSHDDAVSRVLDEVDDVAVVEGVDVHVVHRQDSVSHL